jgi:hypothetical protein
VGTPENDGHGNEREQQTSCKGEEDDEMHRRPNGLEAASVESL